MPVRGTQQPYIPHPAHDNVLSNRAVQQTDWPSNQLGNRTEMRSPSSMSREHDGPVPLTPYSITVEDDRSVAAYTTADTIAGDRHVHDAKQPSTEFPLYYYPVSIASSPEARMSMSGSSTGSYSIPRGGRNWDSAVSSSSNPAERTAPLPGTALDSTHVEAPRAEAGLITESYTKGHPGLRWSAEVSVSDGRNSRSVHDTPNTVTVYTTEDKEGGRSQEPNAVLVLVSLFIYSCHKR